MASRETTATIRTASGRGQKEMVGAKPYLDVEGCDTGPVAQEMRGAVS